MLLAGPNQREKIVKTPSLSSQWTKAAVGVLCLLAFTYAYAQPSSADGRDPRTQVEKGLSSESAAVRFSRLRKSGEAKSSVRTDAALKAELLREDHVSGDWADGPCVSAATMRGFVDDYLAAQVPDFPDRGSPVPGISVSWSTPKCGTFTYAAGLRDIEKNARVKPETLFNIASMTKSVVAAVTLMLADEDVFGPRGLDATVDELLPSAVVKSLTVGDNPREPQCPGVTYLLNRETGQFEMGAFLCPDLSRVSLRDLMRANHGMYDSTQEVHTPDGHSKATMLTFPEYDRYLGIDILPPPKLHDGVAYLKYFGLKQNRSATVGGNKIQDFESSFGNIGFQLLGVILEVRTGKSLDQLVRQYIVEPLHLPEPMVIFNKFDTPGLSQGYGTYPGDPVLDVPGLVYPLTAFHGYNMLRTSLLGSGWPGNVIWAGGAGGLLASVQSYRTFLAAFTGGGLLSPRAQREFERGWLRAPAFDYPGYPGFKFWNGYGLIKQQFVDVPGIVDVELLTHEGESAGYWCDNVVMRSVITGKTLGQGTDCQNSWGVDRVPYLLDLGTQFINAIVGTEVH
jgi:CubicO group peptidase (beta-lactamase class C family)